MWLLCNKESKAGKSILLKSQEYVSIYWFAYEPAAQGECWLPKDYPGYGGKQIRLKLFPIPDFTRSFW